MNGKPGSITGYTGDEINTGRYHVQLSGSGQTVAIRAKNIVAPDGTCVRIHGLNKAAQHNGKYGVTAGFDGERYTVKLDEKGNALKLKADNIAF